jgi:hypothetical protein
MITLHPSLPTRLSSPRHPLNQLPAGGWCVDTNYLHPRWLGNASNATVSTMSEMGT